MKPYSENLPTILFLAFGVLATILLLTLIKDWQFASWKERARNATAVVMLATMFFSWLELIEKDENVIHVSTTSFDRGRDWVIDSTPYVGWPEEEAAFTVIGQSSRLPMESRQS